MHPSAVVYANRAFAHIKLEEYGSAIIDSTEAVALDPTYVKVRLCYPLTCYARMCTLLHCFQSLQGFSSTWIWAGYCKSAAIHRLQGYYRRADANMVLGKHKDAVRDFQKAAKGAKSDPDLKRKLAACQKELQRQRFAKAVARAPTRLLRVPKCAEAKLTYAYAQFSKTPMRGFPFWC